MNSTIKNATEIDIVAVFNGKGMIQAINNVYHDGTKISQDKIDTIMGVPFEKKARFIKECLNNQYTDPALEFQTTCKLTSTFYDSSGIAVAYSLPIIDKLTKEKIGVISTRMRFERLLHLLGNKRIAGNKGNLYFVTDQGGYFHEKINNNSKKPPIAKEQLVKIMEKFKKDNAKKKHISITHNGKPTQLGIYKLDDIKTLSSGGISLMYLADQDWAQSELAQTATHNKLKIAIALLISLCIFISCISILNTSKLNATLNIEYDI